MSPAAQLQALIRSTIPMSEHMQLEISHLDALSIRCQAPLEPNINIHGTGFAGALYTLGALTAWAMIQSRLSPADTLVMMEGNIRYRRPVTSALNSVCHLDAETTERFLSTLGEKGRAKMEVSVLIGDPAKPAAEFTGLMHASH